jgi:hypothetical protein
MAEQILVNISSAPFTVNLPSGRPVTILPGFGVQGDFFLRYLSSGQFVTLGGMPAGMTVRGISQPLATEGTRKEDTAQPKYSNATKRTPPKVAPKTVAVALAEEGKTQTAENLSAAVPSVADSLQSTEGGLAGLNAEQWMDRIQKISDTTLAQQMKVSELRLLAVLLGVASADLLQTKTDLISAIRVKCNHESN